MTSEELAAIRIALSPAADYPFSVHGHVTFGQVRALLAEVDRLRALVDEAQIHVSNTSKFCKSLTLRRKAREWFSKANEAKS